ncbi:uncharacterized protein LOC131292844 [Anopheles ziemanni]|uniref:uncharacterized protein LOC131271252 n=1 Tax=Anopheles coustani TaxID=139045 RepID=UPI00265A99CB|nr:uncharacterized protein LOC131271252 [Anopheles coustani]XP_058176920.1 uncharacterized protein LOC131292844 [Anopheles ziemanni]
MALKTSQITVTYLLFSVLISVVYGIEDGSSAEKAPTTPDSPYETQTAQCTITSGDIEASAQASISKTLVGVCGTEEMLMAFRTLEAKMLEEISNLRKMIRDPHYNPPMLQSSIYNTIKRETTTKHTKSKTTLPQTAGIKLPVSDSTTSARPVPKASTTSSPTIMFPEDDYEDDEDAEKASSQGSLISNSDLVKDLSTTYSRNDTLKARFTTNDRISSQAIDFKPIDQPAEKKFLTGGLRDYEVYRFNNTIISSGDAKVFTYFWKVENFTKRIRAAPETSFSSAVFVISGLNLRLHATVATTKQNDENVLYVQLEQLSDDALRKSPNVILLSGKTYGQVETSTFFRHQIAILNQDEPFSNIVSDLRNTNAKFEAPLASVTNEPYLKNDKLLIKVIIFL